jgi:hypothetical protein
VGRDLERAQHGHHDVGVHVVGAVVHHPQLGGGLLALLVRGLIIGEGRLGLLDPRAVGLEHRLGPRA